MSAGLLQLENPIKIGEDGEEIEKSIDDMVSYYTAKNYNCEVYVKNMCTLFAFV